MKSIFLFAILLLGFTIAGAQHEYAPIEEKEVKYRDWTYKQVSDGADVSLRELMRGKKLVMVVYFAPWCLNWKLQAPFTQKMYDRYKAAGLEIVGIGEYDSVEAMKANLKDFSITFPVVYESDSRAAKLKTLHYEYRRAAGDVRGWGSPWSIFLITSELRSNGDLLTEKTFIVNGELIEAETESFIREKLGLAGDPKKAESARQEVIEVCEPEKKSPEFKKPERR